MPWGGDGAALHGGDADDSGVSHSWVKPVPLPEKSDGRYEMVEAVGGSPSIDFSQL
jgi:hypothetical protein